MNLILESFLHSFADSNDCSIFILRVHLQAAVSSDVDLFCLNIFLLSLFNWYHVKQDLEMHSRAKSYRRRRLERDETYE